MAFQPRYYVDDLHMNFIMRDWDKQTAYHVAQNQRLLCSFNIKHREILITEWFYYEGFMHFGMLFAHVHPQHLS